MKHEDPATLVVARSGELLEAEVDGEMVGLHIDNGLCYGFNGTAYRIWQLIEQPVSFSHVCRALAEEFEMSDPACQADVLAVLKDLERDGLVTLSRD